MPLFAVIDPVAVPRGCDLASVLSAGVSLGRARVNEPAPPGLAWLASVDGTGREALAHFAALSDVVHWGILLESSAPIGDVRRHLRRFLLVGRPGGAEDYFRFYDPRVLLIFLPTCSADQLETFFGPIEAYWSLSEDAACYHEHRFVGGHLVTHRSSAEDGLPADLWGDAVQERNRGHTQA